MFIGIRFIDYFRVGKALLLRIGFQKKGVQTNTLFLNFILNIWLFLGKYMLSCFLEGIYQNLLLEMYILEFSFKLFFDKLLFSDSVLFPTLVLVS